MSTRDYAYSWGKILIDYKAVNEIVSGILGLMSIVLLTYGNPFAVCTTVVSVGGTFSILDGALLLYGIKKENRTCVLIHMIIWGLILIGAKVLVIFLAVHLQYNMSYGFFVAIFGICTPLIFVFLWYIQFCELQFYRRLKNKGLNHVMLRERYEDDNFI